MTRSKSHQYRYLRTFKKFIGRCRSRRDRETVARLVKECCIIDERERENAPRRRANAGTEARVPPSPPVTVGETIERGGTV